MIGMPYMEKPYLRFEVAVNGCATVSLNGHEIENCGYSQGATQGNSPFLLPATEDSGDALVRLLKFRIRI
jgi:hypothetical protein